MRVLHVIPSVSASSGGPSKALAQMERALSGRGIEMMTVTTDDDGDGRRLDVPLQTPVPSNGASRLYFRKQTNVYKVSLPLLAWLRRNVRQFDVVHVHALFSFAPVAAAWVARAAGVPYVIRPLGVLNRYGMVNRRSRMKAWSMAVLENPLLRHAAAVQFTADLEQEEAAVLGVPMHARVIPLGIEPAEPGTDAAFHHAYPGTGAPRLLFLSRIDRKKNIETLLGAVAQSRKSVPGLSLVICGDGSPAYRTELESLAIRLGVDDCVTWAGHVDGVMKASVFAAADIFVLPSFSENFGIAAVEALAAGLPCILGEGVAVSKRISEARAGVAVAPTVAAVSAAINTMLVDTAERVKAGARARALAASDYSVDSMGRALALMYEAIVLPREDRR
ncbi:MAG: glycosyltransferase [Frankiaceae bacterium]|nr:glycosyltransferase [Arenimonas sp.]